MKHFAAPKLDNPTAFDATLEGADYDSLRVKISRLNAVIDLSRIFLKKKSRTPIV